ncbi:hypothetical protein KC19_12G090900 [Ceratodon purpureus]|uniref:MORN repeat-containing protein 3 n=1 Tax=Ceratodon purpureus TaxID=3225 RepID=A0A8T0G7H7_CERPU|nr:hypothetical protein KC19_12G090900 [Ceratodon purpureus]
MEASPKLSTIHEAKDNGDYRDHEQEIPEAYTHYLDRIAGKEGHRVGVYWTSGDHYVGEWHLNLRHGRGMHWYRSGNIYEGEWRNGKKNGHGTFWIKDPSHGNRYIRKYRGSWKDNKYGGHGCIYGLGGEQYNGNCEQGKRNGIGKQTYRDWNSKDSVKYQIYYGNWVDGKREGKGQLTLWDGNVYQGEWRNDWKEGMGVFYFRDKQSKYEGLWRDDIAVSGAYTRGPMAETWLCVRHLADDRIPIPYAWVPNVNALNQKCLKLAASRPPPPRYDRTKRRTDPAVCTKKFDREDIVYGSPLHGPIMNPAL